MHIHTKLHARMNGHAPSSAIFFIRCALRLMGQQAMKEAATSVADPLTEEEVKQCGKLDVRNAHLGFSRTSLAVQCPTAAIACTTRQRALLAIGASYRPMFTVGLQMPSYWSRSWPRQTRMACWQLPSLSPR